MSIVPWFHGDDALPIGQRQRLWLSKPKRHRQRHACIACMTKFQRKHASWHPEKKRKIITFGHLKALILVFGQSDF